jgi:hypothetical protein
MKKILADSLPCPETLCFSLLFLPLYKETLRKSTFWGPTSLDVCLGDYFFLHCLKIPGYCEANGSAPHPFLWRTSPLGHQRDNGSLGVSEIGSEWHRGDSGPVCSSLGPPEMVSAVSPRDWYPQKCQPWSLLVPGGVCGCVFVFLSNLEGVEY